MAIRQLLRSLHNERVATFDADTLMDYRSHRPIVTVDNWVSSPDMVMPQTVLDLVEDDMGNPILVLHGAEPDAHWESFTAAIRDICERAGVEITFSLHGVPSVCRTRVPRPSTSRRRTSRLLPSGSNAISNHMQFPSPLSTFMQIRMGQQGIGGARAARGGAVLHGGHRLPGRILGPLDLLRQVCGPVAPVGDLEQGAAQDQESIEKLVEGNPEISHTVSALEEHFDAWTGGAGAIPLPGMGQPPATGAEEKTPKDIGDVIEAYLAQVSRAQDEEIESVQRAPRAEEVEEPAKSDTLEDVLARVEARRRGEGPGPSSPRHRA